MARSRSPKGGLSNRAHSMVAGATPKREEPDSPDAGEAAEKVRKIVDRAAAAFNELAEW